MRNSNRGWAGEAEQPTQRVGRFAGRQISARDGILVGLFGAGLMIFLLLLFTGQLWRPFGRVSQAALPDRNPVISDGGLLLGAGDGDKADPYPVVSPAINVSPEVAARFQNFYNAHDGLRLFGMPLSQPVVEGGRTVQWFERARFEYHPELVGTAYEVQLGLIGLEYTEGRNFPLQQFFVSRPGLRYFPETGHGVGGLFLEYWQQHGGLDIFGLPISEEFDELLTDGQVHRVQYFQRARMEYWPAYAGSPNQIQLGLLGNALFAKDPRPGTLPPPPTPVPLP